jgi:hypothetical protein
MVAWTGDRRPSFLLYSVRCSLGLLGRTTPRPTTVVVALRWPRHAASLEIGEEEVTVTRHEYCYRDLHACVRLDSRAACLPCLCLRTAQPQWLALQLLPLLARFAQTCVFSSSKFLALAKVALLFYLLISV